MKRWCVAVVLVMLTAAALTAVASAEEKLAKKQVLNYAFDAGDAQTLDPHRAASTVDRSTLDMIFNGLVRYPLGNQVGIEPDLAESWKVSPDAKRGPSTCEKASSSIPFPEPRTVMN